jgi:hypothetical protein
MLHICVCARACVNACPGESACACACVHVPLLIQHATRKRHIVMSFVAPLTPPYFSTFCHKRHNFRGKKVNEHKMCVLISSTTIV